MPPQKIGNAIYHAAAARHTPQSIAVGKAVPVQLSHGAFTAAQDY